ncbi:MAG: ComEA family DNA-binding protein [Burkholderiales bacterium]
MRHCAAILLALLFAAAIQGCGRESEPGVQPKPVPAQKQSQPRQTLIDINRASVAELMTLKGIGEARARAIIRGRPYARKDDLVHKGIISESVYGHIKDQIIARQK